MAGIRKCEDHEFSRVLAVINDAAQAYRDVIPADRWHEPYMSGAELQAEVRAGIEFWCYEADGELLGVMGSQPAQDVVLIRHAYVRTHLQRSGIGGLLLDHIRKVTAGRILVGTWAAAGWAIAFYQRHGFALVDSQVARTLLSKYWSIPQRQIEESVVLACPQYG
jgi:N-acetylglutamate synthase-like GNAT family acetyltransferase